MIDHVSLFVYHIRVTNTILLWDAVLRHGNKQHGQSLSTSLLITYIFISTLSRPSSITICASYYAVYYTDPFTFYVGRALKVDLECIPRQFVFEGPVTLVGSGPFTVENLDEIQKKFEDIKKSQ